MSTEMLYWLAGIAAFLFLAWALHYLIQITRKDQLWAPILGYAGGLCAVGMAGLAVTALIEIWRALR